MKDFIDRLRSYKTTILGVFTAVISILVFFNIVDADNSGTELATSLWDGILQILAAISGFILILSKDSDIKEDPK